MIKQFFTRLVNPLWRSLLVLTWALSLLGGPRPMHQALASEITLDVDTQVDSSDHAFQECTSKPDDCSLRGAITRANLDAASVYFITVPAGVYYLAQEGILEDGNASGALDVSGKGPGCPGMMDTRFDVYLLRQQLGIEIIDLPIQSYIDLYHGTLKDQVVKLTTRVRQKFVNSEADEEVYYQSVMGYIVLRKLIADYDLAAVTVRCWPELKQQDVVSPCLALSLLTDQGLPAGCEGDALGTISMLIAQLLTGRPAFFGDFVAVDLTSDESLLSHCGAGAAGLAGEKREIRLRTHSRPVMWKPGITMEFPSGPGKTTYLRLGQFDRIYRILISEGSTETHKSFCRGTTLRFRPYMGGRSLSCRADESWSGAPPGHCTGSN